MTPNQAIAFIRRHGVVLEAAKGLEPSLAAEVAGGPISGSWWGHERGHEIYALTQHIEASNAVLICLLARQRRTYIHRRLWPAFVRLADRFPANALDQVTEMHLPGGRHKRVDIAFPNWVPEAIGQQAASLSMSTALHQIQVWLQRHGKSES